MELPGVDALLTGASTMTSSGPKEVPVLKFVRLSSALPAGNSGITVVTTCRSGLVGCGAMLAVTVITVESTIDSKTAKFPNGENGLKPVASNETIEPGGPCTSARGACPIRTFPLLLDVAVRTSIWGIGSDTTKSLPATVAVLTTTSSSTPSPSASGMMR